MSIFANGCAELRGLEGMASPFDRTPTPMQNPYTDPSLMESDADKSFSQSTLQQTSQKLVGGQNDAAIAQREREINDIAKGIIELSDIFRELQTMIIDQGTMLDRIDYNVERMGTEVKAADKELKVVCLTLIQPNTLTPSLILPGNKLPTAHHKTQNPPPSRPSCRGHVHPPTRQTETTQLPCTTSACPRRCTIVAQKSRPRLRKVNPSLETISIYESVL